MYRRWVGSLLSLLIPGAGIFLAGDKRAGLAWFLVLTALWMAKIVLSSAQMIPGLFAFWALSVCGLMLWCWIVVRSYRAIPKLGFRGWLVFLLLVAGIQVLELRLARLFTNPFSLPTGSMETTLLRDDHILVQTCAYWFSKPQRGDVVVFKTDSVAWPTMPKRGFFVKRIVALPRERIGIETGHLLIDGQPLNGVTGLVGRDFTPPSGGLFISPTNTITLAADTYFVVGDNLTNSLDSRYFGAIPRQSIIGKATKIYWPLSRTGDIQ